VSGTLFVTGGGGFLGRRVVPTALSAGWQVVAPTSAELDVRDAHAVHAAIGRAGPAAVVHLAYRRDDRAAIVDASSNVAAAARRSGARLVHLSTDVVFGGAPRAYAESCPTDPVDAYGRAKTAAEEVVTALDPSAAIVRTSLLYAADRADPGRPVHDVEAALAGSAFAFFTDEVRCPAAVGDVAAALVALTGPRRDVSGPIHVAGPVALDRLELAVVIARWLGVHEPSLTATTHAALGIARPGRVVLDTTLANSLGLGCRAPQEVLSAIRRRSS
jgi:dTDP-4-dehydrorhamnose reductase